MAEPVLAPALFACAVNVPHSALLANLKVSKERNLPYVDICPPRERALAIVGSGPSLCRTWAEIPPDCDIMALNGAYQYLIEKGLYPKYAVCLDALPENVNFFECSLPETFHLIASQCHPNIFSRLKSHDSHCATFHLDTEAHRTIYGKGEVTSMGAMPTVGLTALVLAAVLGYRKMILYGYDSSFEDVSHARNQPQNEGQITVPVEFKGKWYTTTPALCGQVHNFLFLHSILQKNYPGIEVYLRGSGLFYDFVAGNNGPTSRDKEVAKYEHLYDMPEYGMSPDRYYGIERILQGDFKSRESFVDVGTGRGETMKLARASGFSNVMGTETVEALLGDDVFKAILPKLPFPDKSVAVVSCFEVLEHLYPFDVAPSLKEMGRVARDTLIVSAATMQHLLGGVNLHPSYRSREAWEVTLREALPNSKITYLANLSRTEGVSPCWRIDL